MGAFLNGFRLAEVCRVARTTVAEILDILVMEGVGRLDLTLATMTKIASTLALTADTVQWSGLREGRGQGFGGDPHGRWMVLWDLMLGPGEAPVLNC